MSTVYTTEAFAAPGRVCVTGALAAPGRVYTKGPELHNLHMDVFTVDLTEPVQLLDVSSLQMPVLHSGCVSLTGI